MADVSQISSQQSLTARAKLAWQLLGYQRWVPRSELPSVAQSAIISKPTEMVAELPQSSNMALAFDAPPSLSKAVVNLKKIEISLEKSFVPATTMNTENSDSRSDVVAIEINSGKVWLQKQFTAIFVDNILWILPALAATHKGYHLFSSALEANLWSRALHYVGLHSAAQVFLALSQESFSEAKFNLSTSVELKNLPKEVGNIVIMGSEDLHECAQKLIQKKAIQAPQMLGCTHPALALRRAKYKAMMWQDLEKLKEYHVVQ